MEEINLTCPQCQTHYVAAREEISSLRPEFDCVTCGVRFFFDYDPRIDFIESKVTTQVFPVSKPHIDDVALEICEVSPSLPSTKLLDQVGTVELAKLLAELPIDGAPSTPFLRSLWMEVTRDYENKSTHRRFVEAANESRRLPFAAQQYRLILNSLSQDEIAREMAIKIEDLVAQALRRQTQTLQVNDRSPGIYYVVLLVGLMIAISGLFVPNLRQLIGVGSAIVAVALGFRYFVPRPQ